MPVSTWTSDRGQSIPLLHRRPISRSVWLLALAIASLSPASAAVAQSGSVGGAAPAAHLPPSGSAKASAQRSAKPADPALSASRYLALIEEYQPAAGRDPAAPNAWMILIDALKILDDVDKATWKEPDGQPKPDRAPPDFSLIYFDGRDKPTEMDVASKAQALEHISLLRAAGLGAALDRLAACSRAVRPAFGSEEGQRLAKLGGVAPKDARPSTVMFQVLLPELGKCRAIARHNAAVIELAAKAGDWQTVASSAEHSMALSRMLCHDGFAISRLVGVAISALTTERLGVAIERNSPPPAALRAIAGAIDRQLSSLPPLKLNIQAEQLMAENALDSLFYGKAHPTQAELDALTAYQGTGPGQLKPSDLGAYATMRPQFDVYFDRAASTVDRSWSEIERQLVEIETLSKANSLLGILAPSVRKILMTDLQCRASLGGLRTAIELLLVQSEGKPLPERLSDVATLMDRQTLPGKFAIDPWSGMPLCYRRSAHGKSFELWSVGYDGTDDQGTFDSQNPFVAIQPAGNGTDFRVWPVAK